MHLQNQSCIQLISGVSTHCNLLRMRDTLLTGKVRALWTAVFLDDKSRRLLDQYFPPKLPNHFGDHVTLAIKPSGEKMHLFPAGTLVEVEIIGRTEDKNNRVQAVSVQFKDPDFASKWCAVNQPHVKNSYSIITIS